jgi:hypothetical protein
MQPCASPCLPATWPYSLCNLLSAGAVSLRSTIAQGRQYKPPTGKLCRVFISHAGQEKRGFVAFLREEFKRSHPALDVFVDEYSLKMGGSAMPAIEAALGDAFVGATPPQPLASKTTRLYLAPS